MNFIKSLFLSDHASFKLTDQEIFLLNESLIHIIAQSDHIAADFYKNLFRLNPALKSLFHQEHTIQERKFMSKLVDVVGSSQQSNQLHPVLKELSKSHLLYGIKEEHYSAVGAALLTTLKSQLSGIWNKQLNDAWVSLFTNMVLVMKYGSIKAA